MKTQEYMELFQKYGIDIKPLPQNYDPETYGRELMRECWKEKGVSYSASTNTTKSDNKNFALCK